MYGVKVPGIFFGETQRAHVDAPTNQLDNFNKHTNYIKLQYLKRRPTLDHHHTHILYTYIYNIYITYR